MVAQAGVVEVTQQRASVDVEGAVASSICLNRGSLVKSLEASSFTLAARARKNEVVVTKIYIIGPSFIHSPVAVFAVFASGVEPQATAAASPDHLSPPSTKQKTLDNKVLVSGTSHAAGAKANAAIMHGP